MRGKSNSFRQVTPFYPRLGIPSYVAFPVDVPNPPQAVPSGCMDVTPKLDFVSEGVSGGPFSVNAIIYTIRNTGGAALDWTLSVSETWLSPDNTSGTLEKGETAFVTITLEADDLPFDTDPYTAEIVFTNTTNGCGDLTLGASLTVNQQFELVGDFTPEFRSSSGTASLIGFAEFVLTSSPPKKYRRNTISEAYNWCTYTSSPCTGSAASFANSMAGSAVYDAITGVLTEIPYFDGAAHTGSCIIPSITHNGDKSRFVFDPAFMIQTSNGRLTNTFSVQEPCYEFGPGALVTANGGGSETLSEEDTEADAITRFKLNNPLGAFGPTPQNSEYEARVSGYTFNFAWAEFRVQATGLLPDSNVRIDVTFASGPYPSGPTTPSDPVSFFTTTDGSGNLSFSTEIPYSRGEINGVDGDVTVYQGLP